MHGPDRTRRIPCSFPRTRPARRGLILAPHVPYTDAEGAGGAHHTTCSPLPSMAPTGALTRGLLATGQGGGSTSPPIEVMEAVPFALFPCQRSRLGPGPSAGAAVTGPRDRHDVGPVLGPEARRWPFALFLGFLVDGGR